MSLAQLFYAKNTAKQCRRVQARRPRRHPVLPRRRKLLFERLEPRLLLAADPNRDIRIEIPAAAVLPMVSARL